MTLRSIIPHILETPWAPGGRSISHLFLSIPCLPRAPCRSSQLCVGEWIAAMRAYSVLATSIDYAAVLLSVSTLPASFALAMPIPLDGYVGHMRRSLCLPSHQIVSCFVNAKKTFGTIQLGNQPYTPDVAWLLLDRMRLSMRA